jgi:hypothetical protein
LNVPASINAQRRRCGPDNLEDALSATAICQDHLSGIVITQADADSVDPSVTILKLCCGAQIVTFLIMKNSASLKGKRGGFHEPNLFGIWDYKVSHEIVRSRYLPTFA